MTEKTNIGDIIGIVKTEEKTDSVELKKEYYKNQSKDKHYTYLNYSRDGYIGSFYLNDKPLTNKEVCGLLNEQEERIIDLKNTIIKITIAYQRKHDNTIVNLVDEVLEEDIGDLFIEWNHGDVE